MNELRQRAANVMLGVHLGDAFGVSFEMMTREEILKATGGTGITGPRFDLDPALRRIPDTRGLAPGATSDDSQLADATAEGLIRSPGFSRETHALLHLQALWHDVAGWGGTTKLSLYEIDRWYRAQRKGLPGPPPAFRTAKDETLWRSAEPRDPQHPARRRPNARGNGVAMKIAPFGIRSAMLGGGDFATGEAFEEILAFARLTHADPVCAVAAYAVAGIICDSITDGPKEAYRRLMHRVRAAEGASLLLHDGPERFSEALAKALLLSDLPETLWAFGSEGRSDSMTSVPMAIAIWNRRRNDDGPCRAVLEAINAGGDTDTVASMVGAMAGAASGRADWWPSDWIAALHDRGARARQLGRDLADVASLRRPPDGIDLEALKKELGY